MNDGIYEALARTALFIELDIFGVGSPHRDIIDCLRATTALIIADGANLDSTAGQTALVTLYAQLAMLGLQIDLDVPATELRTPQPPLSMGELTARLVDYSDDLLPGGSSRPSSTPDVIFALGDTAAPPRAVRVAGADWRASVGRIHTATLWRGTSPIGAMAAASAAAADGLRAAIPHIAERLGRQAPQNPRWRTLPDRRIELDLTAYQVGRPLHLGEVDVISGGAITNAALYALLRVPEMTASMRIIEPEALDLTNLNRYALARRSMVTSLKTTILEGFASTDVHIVGLEKRFDEDTARSLDRMAPRLLVGVDHIPSRWAAQQAAIRSSSWVCVGATSHDFVFVSTHPLGSACAGCAHPRDESLAGPIPTISFVSFWAGLHQALELMTDAAGRAPAWARSTYIWPFGLENRHGFHSFAQQAVNTCPVDSQRSRTSRPASLV